MPKGIYFLEQNKSIVSDMEGYFFLKGEYKLVGSSNSLNGVKTLTTDKNGRAVFVLDTKLSVGKHNLEITSDDGTILIHIVT